MQALADQLARSFEEVAEALAATYTTTANSKDAVARLACAREQFMDSCQQLTVQLVQLKQAVAASPQQIGQLLQQPQKQPAAVKQELSLVKTPPPSAAAAAAAAADGMEVDAASQNTQQQQQPAPPAAAEVAAAITQQHAHFLSQLTGRPS